MELVTQVKERGSLGVGNLVKKNESPLGKWLWRLQEERQSLWYAVIRSNYRLQANGVLII